MRRWVKGMRDAFFDSLYAEAKKDKNIVLVTSDTGAICHDDFKKKLPRQYLNVGIAEQNMIGISAGLAMAGKTVFCYAIVPFATMRCYEQIRVDLCCMRLNVNIVGIGIGYDYSTLGLTHHGTEDISLMRALPDIEIYCPADSSAAEKAAVFCARRRGTKYIRIDRTGLPLLYRNKAVDLSKGASELVNGKAVLLISTGRMLLKAVEAAEGLKKKGISAGVLDISRIKPLNEPLLKNIFQKYGSLVSIEEHFLAGGFGSAVLELLNDRGIEKRLLRIGIDDRFCRVYGKREYLLSSMGLSTGDITAKITKWLASAPK